ncbi:2,5-diketo-D-gluconate reductase A [Sediminihabitans luteus]|uniref:2,5-diketo-D-gluconate reductase A n=1 Tax=Sediminihabitans luteus TaxID=1138585 RepID=A0A2M9CC39_9CELL|nr:aldo/keto reductase [Sediminihabitans luteus]PJJ68606.1 2,5-diketo-D-gluconate reductase A [Sediminihabitans luteus]GII99944.1 oxidoreductase [Sediminihabitans luteus]
MPTDTTVPSIMLNNGVQIPQLGFGVFQIPPDETRAATLTALEAGYRHIDTAEMYGNEAGVGEAVRASGLERSDVFVTSKLNNGFHAYDDALAAIDGTLEELEFEHVDLFLIHWPLPDVGDYTETWRAMEEIYRQGKARAIGVSNFQPHHLRKIHESGTVVPAVNQIEVHPYFAQNDVRAFNAEHGIVTEAWSPIAQGAVLDDPTVVRIAEAHGRTPAQVVLRWHVERGDVVFPKSSTPERVRENFALFDFELTEGDLADLGALDRADGRRGPDPDTMNAVPKK